MRNILRRAPLLIGQDISREPTRIRAKFALPFESDEPLLFSKRKLSFVREKFKNSFVRTKRSRDISRCFFFPFNKDKEDNSDVILFKQVEEFLTLNLTYIM